MCIYQQKNYNLHHFVALKRHIFRLPLMNNNIITAVKACPTVFKVHVAFHSKHVTGVDSPLGCCKVLHNAGEKKKKKDLSVFAPVEELVACLEVSPSAIAPSSPLSPVRACCPGNCVKWLY